ncbi:hypothetical protein NK718_01560 [Alsobacter sp. SYSU M60028]|uniref:Uncharacterized protein n=1 Tax=Alsobacter ponti TaxID=2962936 RepID=A0ABT1L717_9HYPH|nr:hypothetical protein [Alsobacter ponti]MCP8937192.1 hypothetical protein [Alsobacter ponti]
MAQAIPLRHYAGVTATVHARPQSGVAMRLLRAVASHIVERRARRAEAELRRHQTFGPLIKVKHIGLATGDLLPFLRDE